MLTDHSLVIFIPDSRPLRRVPPEGVTVDTRLPFWRRRLKEGSMVVATPDSTPTNHE